MERKTPAEMLQYRCKLYRDAHAFRKPERTPYEVALQTWQFYDAGYTPAVASRNYEMMEECITRFFRTYPVDACRNIGLRMPLLLSDAVGGQSVTNDENLSAVDICYTLQAMGKGVQSAVLTACRQGILNVPLLIFMNHMVGLYGMIWTQLVVEIIMLPVSFGMYRATFRHLPAGPSAGGSA